MPIKVRVNGAWVDAFANSGTAPTVPQNVAATSTVSGQIDVTWNAPASPGTSAVTGYTVFATDTTTGSTTSKVTGASARSASITGLVVADTYSVDMQAMNAVGPSALTTPISVVVAGSTGQGSGAGINSSGSNVGEFGAGTFAGYRGPTNVGPYAVYDTGLGRLVASTDLTDYSGNNLSGDVTFSTNNAVYFRLKIRADRILIPATGVQFIQCDIKSNDGSRSKSGSYFITVQGAGNVVKFVDCVIDGNGVSGGNVAPYPSGYGFESIFTSTGSPYVLRCEVKGSVDILKSGHNAYIGYSWIHGNVTYFAAAGTKTHSDHIQIAASSCNDYTIEYCTLGTPKSVAGPAGTTWSDFEYYGNASGDNFVNGGLVQIGSGFSSSATISNLVMRYNYANDGAYMLNGSPAKAGSCTGLISGNRCGPYMQFGSMPSTVKQAALDGSKLTFDGTNVYDDNFIAYWDNSPRTKGQVFA